VNIRYEGKLKKTFNQAIDSISKSLKDRSFWCTMAAKFQREIVRHGIDFPNNFMILEVV